MNDDYYLEISLFGQKVRALYGRFMEENNIPPNMILVDYRYQFMPLGLKEYHGMKIILTLDMAESVRLGRVG